MLSLVPGDAGGMHAAWIGGFVLAAGTVMIFAGFVAILINPPFPP